MAAKPEIFTVWSFRDKSLLTPGLPSLGDDTSQVTLHDHLLAVVEDICRNGMEYPLTIM